MKTPALTALVLLSTLATGCASVTFAPDAKSVGTYKNLKGAAKTAETLPRGSAGEVQVVIDTLPEGMTLKDGVLQVDKARYEVLGKVEANLNNPLAANLGWWVYDYKDEDSWRTAYCAWQVPLSWVTFSVWAFVSPTHYPCKVSMGDDESRTAEIVETLQRAGKAMGADLVVVPGIGGTLVVSGTRTSATVSTVAATNAWGYAVKRKIAPPEATPAPAGNASL